LEPFPTSTREAGAGFSSPDFSRTWPPRTSLRQTLRALDHAR